LVKEKQEVQKKLITNTLLSLKNTEVRGDKN
jgi:hypothetical protein